MFRNRERLVKIGIWVVVIAMLLPIIAVLASGL